jgi:hypothetical protein
MKLFKNTVLLALFFCTIHVIATPEEHISSTDNLTTESYQIDKKNLFNKTIKKSLSEKLKIIKPTPQKLQIIQKDKKRPVKKTPTNTPFAFDSSSNFSKRINILSPYPDPDDPL